MTDKPVTVTQAEIQEWAEWLRDQSCFAGSKQEMISDYLLAHRTAHAPSQPTAGDEYRCHHCKLVLPSTNGEPGQCPECNHRTFSKCDAAAMPASALADIGRGT